MKLKLFKEAELELDQFGDFIKPQYFYEFHGYEYPGRKGSMIPFGLRMLNAELPQYLGRVDDAIANLYHLRSVVQDILDEFKDTEDDNLKQASKVWYDRKIKILFSIINILIAKKVR